MTKQGPTRKLSRWALELQEYDMEIVYRKRCENVVADALSADSGANCSSCEYEV